jgi:RHS repeat-associated protein
MLSKTGRGTRLSSRWRVVGTAALVLAVLPAMANLVAMDGAIAAPAEVSLPARHSQKRVPLTRSRAARKAPAPKPFARFDPSGYTSLPEAASATVTMTKASPNASLSADGATAGSTGMRVRAGATPVFLSAVPGAAGPGAVRVTTVAQSTARAAGVHGMLFALRSMDGAGSVGVDVDATTFRNAYGGDYASRLRLVRLPSCALTTPRVAECQVQTPLRMTGSPLSVRVALPVPATSAAAGLTVLAATSSSDGSSGDYSATSLSAGGTWSVSGNTGAFTYNYPIAVPDAIGGPAPNIDLSYNSATQDARTDGTNNQSSWLGDGWSSTDSFVERTYKACTDVSSSGAPKQAGDECWAGQILTLSLNGSSTPIVYDDATKLFRPVNDDSTTKIEDLTGAANGTTNGEYFRVTENGVQYYFGLNRLPGWSGDEETKSAWAVRVYKAHTAVSACPDGDFADAACDLGYRFNLDYVVDPHGNAMAYYYSPEAGFYGADAKNKAVAYTRGGTLKRIDYGMTSSTIYAHTAPAQVLFDATAERCLAGRPAGNTCADSQFTASHPEYWPDVPVDLQCDKDATDCTIHGPSFWSRKRLTSITTQVQVGGQTKQVDRYDFTQSFPDGGDHAPTLWLDSIRRTGLDHLGGASGTASAGEVSFDPPLQLPNRVGTLPGLPAMYHDRIQIVTTETGAQSTVVYNTPDCSSVPASDLQDPADSSAAGFASTNGTSCFPVYWTPEGQPAPLLDWFYLHTVKSVATIDPHDSYQDGTEPGLLTEYAYKGKPGWHYDDNETVKAKNRTWAQFRGYPEVDTTTGDPNVFHYTDGAKVYDQRTLTKTFYFLGMDGDTLPNGKTRNVPDLTSQDGSVSVADDNALAGRVFETDVYTGATGTINQATVSVPKIIGPTASRARTGLPALTAQMVRSAKTLTRQAVSYGWRKTENDTFYNTTLHQSTTGMEVQSDDRGEVGASGNVAKCVFTRYLDGSADTVIVPAEVWSTDQDCSSAGASPSGSLTADVRTSYDGHPFAYNGDGQNKPALPSTANVTLVQHASAADGAAATAFVDETAMTYDSYGRTTSVTRTPHSVSPGNVSLAQTVYTTYTPAGGALPTAVTTTTQVTPGTDCSAATVSSKDCEISSVSLDAARQQPVSKTDVASSLTSLTYDALGRLTGVWLPNQSKATDAPANMLFSYALSDDKPSRTTSSTLLDDGTYSTGEVLYDAMLRRLETQAVGENGSTTVTDTQYDSHGWTVLTNNAYSIAGNPSSGLISDHISQVSIPDTTITDHDGAGRPTRYTEEHNGVRTWDTRTAYAGDKTTVIPPTGGVATMKTTNARGQTVQLDQYTSAPTLTGTPTTGYTAGGGTSQNIKYAYNATGQQSKVIGPDNTVWTFGYDLLGRQTSRSDPDAGASSSVYDDAGNLVSTTDAKKIELDYTYDLLGRKLIATDRSKNDFQFASWTYDTLRIGQPTSSTRYVPGVTGGYTVATTGYTRLNKPAGTKITLPASEAPLPTAYTTSYSYSINTELLTSQTDPRTQGLLGETIGYEHDALGKPTTTASSAQLYVSGTLYTDFGEPSQVTMGASTNQARAIYSYDDQTHRLTGRTVSRTQAPGPLVDDISYTYDAAGNPLTTTDRQSETGNTTTDTQCYRYDSLDRLTDAWTAKADCPTAGTSPTSDAVSGAAGSYWQTYSYDLVGDRTNVVDHSVTGAADTSTVYTNGCTTGCNATGAQPHALTGTTGTNPSTFANDADGNMLARTPVAVSAPGQKLTWDDEGRLAQVDTTGAKPTSTSYLYDADGNQLIRRDPGRTTLFAGDTQVVVNTAVTPHVLLGAVRTYFQGGAGPAVAVHSSLPGGGTDYLLDDPHGTAGLAMDTTTQKVSRHQYTPYGQLRSSANNTAWPDLTHAFLGAPQNVSTGYSDLGLRKYDPVLGRFISPDPVLETADPNQLGGYTYSGDNPTGHSDPSGADPCPGGGGGCGYKDTPSYIQNPGACGSANACEQHQNDANGGGSGSGGSSSGGCKLSCVLSKPAPHTGVPLHAMRTIGYAGSPAYTYQDAVNWASQSEAGYMLVCLHTFGRSEGSCRGSDPWTKPNDRSGWLAVAGPLLLLGALAAVTACVPAVLACLTAAGSGVVSFYGYGGGGDGVGGDAESLLAAGASGAENVNAAVGLANDLVTAEAANPLIESLRSTGQLPANYVTKAKAEAAGWAPSKALWNKIPGAQIGGDVYRNDEGIVPVAPGRTWYEADVGMVGNMGRNKQPGTRLLYSNDGLAYVTPNHYEDVYQLPNWK